MSIFEIIITFKSRLSGNESLMQSIQILLIKVIPHGFKKTLPVIMPYEEVMALET